jgi:hypothetical protein
MFYRLFIHMLDERRLNWDGCPNFRNKKRNIDLISTTIKACLDIMH